MIKLSESGLLRHDLDNLILPLVEIDTFESKIDNARAIVVAFFAFDQEPARDLERFVENSDVNLLDAETSPAPTEDGYYVVFLELARDAEFPEKLVQITEAVNNTTNIEQWQFKTFNDPDIHDLSDENIKKFVNLNPKQVEPDAEDEHDELQDLAAEKDTEAQSTQAISEVLQYGLMENYTLSHDIITLKSLGLVKNYRVIMNTKTEPSIPICGLNIGNPLINESSILNSMLGNAYTVDVTDNALLVSSFNGFLLLEPID